MHKIIVITLLCLSVSSVDAAILQFSATGQLSSDDGAVGTFSVSMAFDSSVIDSEQIDPDTGIYGSTLGTGVVTINGVTYSELPSGAALVIYNNFFDGGDVDTFALNLFFENDQGSVLDMDLVLRDSSNSVFSDDSHPNEFTLDQFDPFSALDPFSSTVAAFYFFDTGQSYLGPIETAELAAVPVPAALWLFLSAFGVFHRCSRRRA